MVVKRHNTGNTRVECFREDRKRKSKRKESSFYVGSSNSHPANNSEADGALILPLPLPPSPSVPRLTVSRVLEAT